MLMKIGARDEDECDAQRKFRFRYNNLESHEKCDQPYPWTNRNEERKSSSIYRSLVTCVVWTFPTT